MNKIQNDELGKPDQQNENSSFYIWFIEGQIVKKHALQKDFSNTQNFIVNFQEFWDNGKIKKLITNDKYFKDGFFLKDFQSQKKIPLILDQNFIYQNCFENERQISSSFFPVKIMYKILNTFLRIFQINYQLSYETE